MADKEELQITKRELMKEIINLYDIIPNIITDGGKQIVQKRVDELEIKLKELL